ncbi:unnamed protein product [Phytophthora fragariaefolia]|uniref:Unnamed protein product n=1 Tax=Phytophthora fragariaefolia TaxID=1490495 RepID=A0A9W6XWB6_9STRA|nr:unnamed protein product [Phytophthora fragariaefolia]
MGGYAVMNCAQVCGECAELRCDDEGIGDCTPGTRLVARVVSQCVSTCDLGDVVLSRDVYLGLSDSNATWIRVSWRCTACDSSVNDVSSGDIDSSTVESSCPGNNDRINASAVVGGDMNTTQSAANETIEGAAGSNINSDSSFEGINDPVSISVGTSGSSDKHIIVPAMASSSIRGDTIGFSGSSSDLDGDVIDNSDSSSNGYRFDSNELGSSSGPASTMWNEPGVKTALPAPHNPSVSTPPSSWSNNGYSELPISPSVSTAYPVIMPSGGPTYMPAQSTFPGTAISTPDPEIDNTNPPENTVAAFTGSSKDSDATSSSLSASGSSTSTPTTTEKNRPTTAAPPYRTSGSEDQSASGGSLSGTSTVARSLFFYASIVLTTSGIVGVVVGAYTSTPTLVRRFVAHFTSASTMGKHVLSAVIVLVSLAAAQGHLFFGRYLRESAGSSGTDSSGQATVNAGDSISSILAINRLDASFDNSSSQEIVVVAANNSAVSATTSDASSLSSTLDPGREATSNVAASSVSASTWLPSSQLSSTLRSDVVSSSPATPVPATVLTTSSTSTVTTSSSISSSSTTTSTITTIATTTSPQQDAATDSPTTQETDTSTSLQTSLLRAAETTASSSTISKPTADQVAAPAASYTLSNPTVASPSPTSRPNEASQPASSPSSTPNSVSYATDSAAPTEERAAAENASEQLSASPQQVEDATTPSPPVATSTAPKTSTSGKTATSTTDQSSADGRQSADPKPDPDPVGSKAADEPTSYLALRSPIFYACVVLAVAGLVGAAAAFRAKRKCDERDERRAASELPAATPRRREQEAKCAAEEKATTDTAVDALPLDKLSLGKEEEATPTARDRLRSSGDSAPRQEQERRRPLAKDTKSQSVAAAGESAGDQQQQRKRQLTKINKQLKDIAKLEDSDTSYLTTQQKQKIERKTTLQRQRNEIIAELNGATITRSSGSTVRPKVAISL